MKVLMVCHKTNIDGGIFYDYLRQMGAEIDLYMAYKDPLSDIDPSEHDLAIFMGGPMGVYQADIFPYLNNEISYIQKRLKAKKPYLGICLGAQLLAQALGSQVRPGEKGKEIGWHSVTISKEAQKTPLRFFDSSVTSIMQWHGDTFDVPQRTELLASSRLYESQIIQHGTNALGFQFHPEVNEDIIEMWMTMGFSELQQAGLNVPALRQQCYTNLPIMKKQTESFFKEWLEQVVK